MLLFIFESIYKKATTCYYLSQSTLYHPTYSIYDKLLRKMSRILTANYPLMLFVEVWFMFEWNTRRTVSRGGRRARVTIASRDQTNLVYSLDRWIRHSQLLRSPQSQIKPTSLFFGLSLFPGFSKQSPQTTSTILPLLCHHHLRISWANVEDARYFCHHYPH